MSHISSRTSHAAILMCGLLLAAHAVAAQTTPRSVVPNPRAAAPSPAPAPPSTADRARPTQAPAGDDYRMQIGDKLRIEVYKDAQLSQSVQIRPDGKITLPLIGDIAAKGITPIDLRDRVTTALKEYVNNPVVTVIVVEGTSPTAYIVGEVNNPGPVTLQGEMTVLQAIALAGGIKDFADEKNIRILRNGGVTGGTTIPFNYKDALRGVRSATIYLQPGDTVVVPD